MTQVCYTKREKFTPKCVDAGLGSGVGICLSILSCGRHGTAGDPEINIYVEIIDHRIFLCINFLKKWCAMSVVSHIPYSIFQKRQEMFLVPKPKRAKNYR